MTIEINKLYQPKYDNIIIPKKQGLSNYVVQKDLPSYVVFDKADDKTSIRKIAQEIKFPLSKEDLKSIQILEQKFDEEKHCAGLAAPQIGIGKAIIIFRLPDDDNLKKLRPSITDTMPKTMWLNPKITRTLGEVTSDLEACFSVNRTTGYVSRPSKIEYEAQDLHGNVITGTARGFLARIIQHEIDHIERKLFIDYIEPQDLITDDAYDDLMQKRLNSLEAND